MAKSMDPLEALGQVTFLDENLKVLLSGYLARDDETYGLIYHHLLGSVPVAVRIKLLGKIMDACGWSDEAKPLVTELRELFASRNVYAHAVWVYVSPDRGRWDGLDLRGEQARHVGVTQDEVAALVRRVLTAHERINELHTRLPVTPVHGKGSGVQEQLAIINQAMEGDKARRAEAHEEIANAVAQEVARLLALESLGPDE
jgi:hypothetical protein